MTYYIKGLEYLGRNVTIRGKKKAVEAKRFVTLGKSNSKPSKDDVLAAAKKNSKVKKVWVMQMDGNKWKKVGEVIDL